MEAELKAMKEKESYIESFSRFEKSAVGNSKSWLRRIRQDAIGRFSEQGFPTIFDEEWRFTNLSPILRTSFKLASENGFRLSSAELKKLIVPDLTCNQVVLVNGRYASELSALGSLPDGVKVTGLAQAFDSDEELLERHLAQYVDYQSDAFSALNNAFMEDGVFVYIPKGVVVKEPIHILYVSAATEAPLISHPHNLIVAEDDSQAFIVEDYVSLNDNDTYFSNVVTEIVAGENTVLSHYLIERESKKAFNISTLRVQQSRNSNFSSHSVLIGGSLVRNNVHPVMVGEGCDCLVNGLFMANGRQHMDNYMRVEHASPHCDSRQFYNGILDGRAHGVFSGRIVVHKGAQKTDAKQTNRNLVLSERAQIDTKPQLEIYADDVKCTHGATIGQLNQEAIFYLRSRGIDEELARTMLLVAFANESIERMKIEPMRRYLNAAVTQWFNQRKQSG
jgi:Fe-S cluster assembly protein SufD